MWGESALRYAELLRWLAAVAMFSLLLPILLPIYPILPAAEAAWDLSDITASAHKLDRLFNVEKRIVDALEQILKVSEVGAGAEESPSESHLELAKRYLESYRTDHPLVDAPSNPVRDFKLLQRVENHWSQGLTELLAALESGSESLESLKSLGEKPGSREAVETILALFTVQSVYNLDVQELAEGKLMGLETGAELTMEDLQKLSEVALNSRILSWGLLWLETTLWKAQTRGNAQKHAELTDQLTQYRRKHDEILAAGGEEDYTLFPEPIKNGTATELQRRLRLSRRVGLDSEYTELYSVLCQGHDLRNQSVRSQLRCFHARPHPYYQLQPLRAEALHHDPYIIAYHQFLTQPEMDQFIAMATPKVVRSGVGAGSDHSMARLSSTARFQDSENPLVGIVSRRIQLVTGLDTTNRPGYSQERMQVAEYGTGGFFGSHVDFLNLEDPAVFEDYQREEPMHLVAGERIATMMIYLSPVLRGGRTVFTRQGLSIEPQPGTAIYWENLKPDGTGDHRTEHSGCPVAFGYKWIANKFIRYTAQTFRRPCLPV